MQTSGPASLVGMFGWYAWWYERKKGEEKDRRIFKLSAAQVQSVTRMESALQALRELIRDRDR